VTLAELRAIAEAATPGPWGFSDDWVISPEAADFIDACSPTTVLSLLDVAEAARQHLDPSDIQHRHDGLREALDRLEEME
jgi:hypothetical protein